MDPIFDTDDALVVALRQLLIVDDPRFPGATVPAETCVGIMPPDDTTSALPYVVLNGFGGTLTSLGFGIGTGSLTLDVDVRAEDWTVGRNLSYRIYAILAGAPLWLPPGVLIDRCDVMEKPGLAESDVEGVVRWYATYDLTVR